MAPKPVPDPIEQRRGPRDRRKVNIPQEWPDARVWIQEEFEAVWTMADDIHAIRQLLEQWGKKFQAMGIKQAVLIGIATAIGLAALTLMTRHFDRSLAASTAAAVAASEDARDARLEEIVDALWGIPAGDAYRIPAGPREGFPRVQVLRDRTGMHVTALERDAACRKAPEACRP